MSEIYTPPSLGVLSEYRGFQIADKRRVANLTCPFIITVPGFGPLGALTLEQAHAKVDGIIARRERPAQPGEVTITAILPNVRMHKASTTRNMRERANGRRRATGKFT